MAESWLVTPEPRIPPYCQGPSPSKDTFRKGRGEGASLWQASGLKWLLILLPVLQQEFTRKFTSLRNLTLRDLKLGNVEGTKGYKRTPMSFPKGKKKKSKQHTGQYLQRGTFTLDLSPGTQIGHFFFFLFFVRWKGERREGPAFFKWSNGMPSATWEAFSMFESTLQREWDAETVQSLFV